MEGLEALFLRHNMNELRDIYIKVLRNLKVTGGVKAQNRDGGEAKQELRYANRGERKERQRSLGCEGDQVRVKLGKYFAE